ncbi:MAG TPA: YMGG-like glycine zipper-containing protein [Acidobacteriaceae bacterium]
MKTGYFKKFGTTFLLTPALLLATLPASAQDYGRDNRNQRPQQAQRYDRDRRDNDRNHDRDVRNRDYDRHDYGRDGYRSTGYVTYAPAYTSGYYRQDNGIGPGKGAAIGAVSGAVLGALFGGGKGALIGGAAGAGVGAVAGQAAQDHRRNY